MKQDVFWKEIRNSSVKENEYFVTLNGKLLPTLEYVQQMFLADNIRIQLTNKFATISIVVSIISMVISLLF